MGRNDVVAVVAPVWSDKPGRHEALALLDMGEWDVDSTLLCPMSELHGLFIAGPQAFRRPCPVVVSFRVGGVGDCCRRGRLFESFVGESGGRRVWVRRSRPRSQANRVPAAGGELPNEACRRAWAGRGYNFLTDSACL